MVLIIELSSLLKKLTAFKNDRVARNAATLQIYNELIKFLGFWPSGLRVEM